MHKILILLFLTPFLLVTGQQNRIEKSSILGPFLWHSKVFPGTERNYWLYVPKQYQASKPACLMVVQDGLSRATSWRLPIILDSLIAINVVPVMIGIFIDPGIVSSTDSSNHPRFNRSFEYDALGDRYARFLLEEILPEVSRSYNLSKDPNDRSIAGASSGAICAFNVAWERPDEFRRIFSSIGTYVGLRGGHEFSTLIRKTEAKPLRIFLQDGTRDNNIYAGDWWLANQEMLSAFRWAGYEVNHSWGEGGGHDSKHTVTILADALKWLWKDYPAVIQTHTDSVTRTNLLLKNQPWEEIPLKGLIPERLAVDKSGKLFFGHKQFIYKYDMDGNSVLLATLPGKAGPMSFHQDGKLYVCNTIQHTIISIDEKGTIYDVVSNVNADFLTITNKGIYFTETQKKRVGFYSFLKKQIQFFAVPGNPTGLAISAEQTFINIGFNNLLLGHSFKIMEDGSLTSGQEFIHYHLSYAESSPRTSGIVADTANLIYSATISGIQVSDQLGRINYIITNPVDTILDIKIAGPDLNYLFVNGNGKLFRRKINTKGILSWLPPVKPPKPRL